MKTSNKILAAFFLVVFLVPVMVVMAFKSKIKNGEFVAAKNEPYHGAHYRSGSFKPYKVLKIKAPANTKLNCELQYSDSLFYSYNNDGVDSIRLYNVADTLVVEYVNNSAKSNPDHFRNELEATLKLPAIPQLIVENATATISSINPSTTNDLQVEVIGTGELQIRKQDRGYSDATDTAAAPMNFRQLSVKSADGQVHLGKSVKAAQVNLDIHGKTILSIEEGAVIESLQGSLSDSSVIKASWQYVKKLLPLTGNQ